MFISFLFLQLVLSKKLCYGILWINFLAHSANTNPFLLRQIILLKVYFDW